MTSVEAPISHLRENPFEIARAQLRRVASMFDIDSNLDILVRQGALDGNPLSFESGQLFTIGPLGVNTTSMVGLDIEQTPLLCPCNNTTLRTGAAFASLTSPGDSVSKLYTIDLKTGAATLQGTIGGGEVIRDIAAVQIIGLFGFSRLRRLRDLRWGSEAGPGLYLLVGHAQFRAR